MMAKSATVAPPGPKGPPLVGQMFSLMQDPLGCLESMAKTYGEICRFSSGPITIYLLTNPEHIRDVLVTNASKFKKGRALEKAKKLLGEGLLTSEGQFHLRQRRLMQPAFHRQRIAAYGETMVAYAQRSAGQWQPGQEIDLGAEMNRLTLAIAAKTLFNTDVEAEAQEIGEALTDVLETFNLYSPFAALMDKLPVPSTVRRNKAVARLDATIYRIIEEHRQGGEDRGDLISMLIAARDEDDQGSMTDLQVRDEAMTVFLAGHETTANALTWTLYLLSQNPEVESQLVTELDQVLAGRTPTVADLPGLTYARMVFSESMRIYPPAWAIGRRALEDYPVGDYVIPKGDIVLLVPWVTHHDPRYYPEPLTFDPERWTPERIAERPKFSYFPFGGGPRVCMGEQFAWMEGVLVLAALLQQWRFRFVPGQTIVPQALVTLRPKFGLRMTVERRTTPGQMPETVTS